VAFTFLPTHRTLREQFEQTRPWIEAAAARIAGRKVSVVSQQADAGAGAAAPAPPSTPAPGQSPNGKKDLKAEAMASPAVQAVLEVFPAEIKDVEEL
jgi:hypothetical protein